jgi:group I intron endonuclease
MQGIYSYTNTINGKVYIGHSINLKYRSYRHVRDLNKGVHDNRYLQRAWNKYGLDKFIYEEIVCGPFDKKELVELEQFYIDKYDSRNPSNGYNILPASGSRAGIKSSEETKEKVSIAMKGNKHNLGNKASEETKKKMSLSQTGKRIGNKYGLGNKSRKGQKRSPEEVEKRKLSIQKILDEKLLVA